jgi:hypothetical protein
MLTAVDFFRRKNRDLSRFHAEMCTSKSPLNISATPGLTMKERARRSMNGAFAKNIAAESICYTINALARRFHR